MGKHIADIILKRRVLILGIIAVLTLFMGFWASQVGMQFEVPKLLPKDHPDELAYQTFREEFDPDGFEILIGVKKQNFYNLETITHWMNLSDEIKKVAGIDTVFSESNVSNLVKNDSLKTFEFQPILNRSQLNNESIANGKKRLNQLPFYRNTFFNEKTGFHAMVALVNPSFFNSKKRGNFVVEIQQIAKKYEGLLESEIHLTGLPFLRASNMVKIKGEFQFFTIFSLLVTLAVLFFFFRSHKLVLASILVVVIGVIWTVGFIGIFGFDISIIMGLLPPLIVVIGIPNCVYILNKFGLELKQVDKTTALKRVIVSIGYVALLTNLTTAFGLSTFTFTSCAMLVEFGLVAFCGIVSLFVLSILLIPIFLSYFTTVKMEQLHKPWLFKFIEFLKRTVLTKRKTIYLTSLGLMLIGVAGVLLLKVSGKMVDDLPKNDKARKDLMAFQDNLTGIMPMEIVLESVKKNRFQNPKVLKRIDSVQSYLESFKEIGKTFSYVDGLKFTNQAFHNGKESWYKIPKKRDLFSLSKYIRNSRKSGTFNNTKFVDSTGFKTRISAQVYDVGIDKLEALLATITPKIDEILNPDKDTLNALFKTVSTENDIMELFEQFPYMEHAYLDLVKRDNPKQYAQWYEEGVNFNEVLKGGAKNLQKAAEKTYLSNKITGFMVPFTRGTHYLVYNLLWTLLIAIVGIALLMALLFRSIRMVLITVAVNLLPLLFTAGLMGFLGISIKPSTLLIFSISLGIAVDDAIHFLAKYKLSLKQGLAGKEAVLKTLDEVGISMFHTSAILFVGFSIFIFSSYGGTQALGLLTSITLLVAMLANLLLLPSLLLSFKRD